MLRSFLAGVLQTGIVVAGVLAFGLGWAGVADLAEDPASAASAARAASGASEGRRPGPYTPGPMSDERWLVDGFNVLHAGVLRGADRRGWWREEVRARLLERVAGFEDAAAELWVVFDGPGPAGAAERDSERPRVVFAPSADAWLLDTVRDTPDPSSVVVVTADRQLADRARHRGARIVSPRAFLARCASEARSEPEANGVGTADST